MTAEELTDYKGQLRLVEEQLLACIDEEKRLALLDMKNDLVEMVELLKEQVDNDEISQDASTSSADSDKAFQIDEKLYDELVGMAVMVPFPRAELAVKLHSAIVLDIEPPRHGQSELRIRVLYSHPLLLSMKPCQHFLKGTCRYVDQCRFSHGELVLITDLEEYKEPDFTALSEGCLLLAQLQSGLWEIGRLTSRDKNESAVKILKTGTEVAVANELLYPIDDFDTEPVSEDIRIRIDEYKAPATEKDTSWSELKGSSNGRVTVSDLGKWTGGGFGLKLMQKMGYKLGEGLGKNNDGIVHAIQPTICPKGQSVDVVMEKGKKVVDGKIGPKEKAQARLRANLARQHLDVDVFAFINKKLAGEDKKTELRRLKEEKKEMSQSSQKSLGIKEIDLATEIKQLESKKRKLEGGLIRNKGDRKTCDRLNSELNEVSKAIDRVQGKRKMIGSELDDRKKRTRDLF